MLLEFQPSQAIADKVTLFMRDADLLDTTPHTKGEFAPGWYVAKVTKLVFNTQACQPKIPPIFSRYSVGGNGVELQAADSVPTAFQLARGTVPAFLESNVSLSACHTQHSFSDVKIQFPEALALYGRNIVLVDIMVSLQACPSRHKLAFILPCCMMKAQF